MAEERIGGAWFGLSVNSEEFAAQMNAAKQAAASGSQGIATSMGGASQSIKEATKPARDFRQALSGVAGIVGSVAAAASTLIEVIKKLNETFEDGGKRAERFASENLKRASDSVKSDLEKTRSELQKVQSELAQDLEENPLLEASPIYQMFFGGRSRIQIDQEIKTLSELQSSLSKQLNAQRLREIDERERAENEAALRLQDTQRKAHEDNMQRFRDYAKMVEDEEKKQEQRRQAGLDLWADGQRAFREFVDAQEKERIASEKRIADQKLRLELDNIKRAEDYRRSLTQGFGIGDTSTTDLGSLTRAIQDLASTQIQTRD